MSPANPNTPPTPPPSDDAPESKTIDINAEPADALEADSEDTAERRQFVITRDTQKRLDVYLQQRLKGISRSRVQKLIDLGGVTVNDQHPKHSTTLREGDRVHVILPPQAVRTIEPEPIPLDVIHEDDHLIVINKQAGLIVHPARSNLSGTLLNGLAHRFAQQQQQAGLAWREKATRGFRTHDPPDPEGAVEGLSTVGAAEFRPGIVHRLDKNTTGVMVVAKNDEAHWAIARQFETRTTVKAYLAVVHGNFDTPGGVIEQPLGKHPTIREAQAVRHDSTAKQSVTLYRVRRQYRGFSLVELELKTGRTHQIRVHLSYIGHPLVGDIIYGGEPITDQDIINPPTPAGARQHITFARTKEEGQRVEAEAAQRPSLIIAHPALHAAMLRITHPQTQKPVTYTAPLHEPLRTLIQKLQPQQIDAPTADSGYWIDLTAALNQPPH